MKEFHFRSNFETAATPDQFVYIMIRIIKDKVVCILCVKAKSL